MRLRIRLSLGTMTPPQERVYNKNGGNNQYTCKAPHQWKLMTISRGCAIQMAYSTTGAPRNPSRQTIREALGRRHLHDGERGHHSHHLCLVIVRVCPRSRNLYGPRPQQRPPLRQGALPVFLCTVAVQPLRREVRERRPLRRPDHSPSNENFFAGRPIQFIQGARYCSFGGSLRRWSGTGSGNLLVQARDRTGGLDRRRREREQKQWQGTVGVGTGVGVGVGNGDIVRSSAVDFSAFLQIIDVCADRRETETPLLAR